MINFYEVNETNKMIEKENLDVRTITMGISLLDCIDSDLEKLKENIYNKIYESAKDLVATGEEISREFGIPIVNKRISVTPIALIGGAACKTVEDFASIAKTDVSDVVKSLIATSFSQTGQQMFSPAPSSFVFNLLMVLIAIALTSVVFF